MANPGSKRPLTPSYNELAYVSEVSPGAGLLCNFPTAEIERLVLAWRQGLTIRWYG